MSSFWISRNQEQVLRENGYTVPEYPEEGNVGKDSLVVGRVDNFNGLTITDEDYTDEVRKLLPTAAFWR